MAAGDYEVLGAYVMNISLSLACILAFSIIRKTRLFRKFVAPKRFDKCQLLKPKRPSASFFGWIPAVWQYTEHDIIEAAGLDTAVYLRILQFGVEAFFYISAWCLVAVLPVNLSGDALDTVLSVLSQPSPPPAPPLPPPVPDPPSPPSPPDGFPRAPECIYLHPVKSKDYTVTTFDKCSVSNLPKGSPLFWVHVVTIYFITIVVLQLVSRYNREIIILRNVYISKSAKGGPSHTVLVTDIPGVFYGTLGETLQWVAGGTIFRFLPQSLRKTVLNKIDEYANIAVVQGSKLSISKALKGDDDEEEPKAGQVSTPGASAAVEVEPHPPVTASTPYGTTVSFIEKRQLVTYADLDNTVLDPWHQAQSVLKQGRSIHELVQLEFELVYGTNAVAAVNVVHDQRALEVLVARYHKTRTALEDYLDQLSGYARRRKHVDRRKIQVIPPLYGKWAVEMYGVKPLKLDAIQFWMEALVHQIQDITAEQQKALETEIPTAFVTFYNRQNQCIASNSLMHHEETAWKVQGAPEHFDILWNNLKMRSWERTSRSLVMWMAFATITLFYSFPVSFVQLMVEAPDNWDGNFWRNPFVSFMLRAILPGLVLKIFLVLLPPLLALMCRLSGFISESSVDYGVVSYFFIFQVIAVFFGNMIVGSLVSELSTFLSSPRSFFELLGISIPKTATFFTTYIMISSWTTRSIWFLRIPRLIYYATASRFAATPRSRARLWAEQFTTYGKTVVDQTIMILLGLSYAVINPIVCPTVWISFILNTIYERYLNIYVFKRRYESGGLLWRHIFTQIMVSLYIMQVGVCCLLFIKDFQGAAALVPSIGITMCFHMAYVQLYARPWAVLSLHDTAELDFLDVTTSNTAHLTAEELEDIRTKYLSPVFKISQADIADLLAEAKFMDKRLNGNTLEVIKEALEDEQYVSASEGEDDDIKPVSHVGSVVLDIEEVVQRPPADVGASSTGIRSRGGELSLQMSKPPSQVRMLRSSLRKSDVD